MIPWEILGLRKLSSLTVKWVNELNIHFNGVATQYNSALNITETDVGVSIMGKVYGPSTKETTSVVKLLVKIEGIFLDLVYNGKAFSGMLTDRLWKNPNVEIGYYLFY